MNPPQVYMCSLSWTLLPPPFPYHPSGSSQYISPKHPVSCIDLDWRLISYMILYIFQCHSPMEKTLESPLDCKEIQPVHPKGNQFWILIERTDAEAETPILWPPAVKNWLIGKDPVAGKDWRRDEKGMTENEMVWWYHSLNGHEFEQAPGVGDGQGSLECSSPWSRKE